MRGKPAAYAPVSRNGNGGGGKKRGGALAPHRSSHGKPALRRAMMGRLRRSQSPSAARLLVCLAAGLALLCYLGLLPLGGTLATGLKENVHTVVELLDGCKAVGMGEVAAGPAAESAVQGEGQSWNHVGQASGDSCASRLTQRQQLREMGLALSDLPRVYVYEPKVNALAAEGVHCEEQFFVEVMRANVTGTLVLDPQDADWIYVAFHAQCFPNGKMANDDADRHANANANGSGNGGKRKALLGRARRRSTPFDLLWSELQERGDLRGRLEDVFIFSERHWTKRTGFGLDIRHLLKKYPFTLLSPEITNLQEAEVQVLRRRGRRRERERERAREKVAWLSRHVVVPQPPLVAWPLADGAAAGGRPHRFCFSGTQINRERRVLARVLSHRNDSMVVAGCRRDRKSLQHHLRNNKFSAAQQYRACEMCLIPHGDSLSDRRLFDAMASGCVPVVTPRMRPLPFATRAGGGGPMDYGEAILTLQHRNGEAELERRLGVLARLPASDLAERRAAAVRLAQRLSFSECGGHAGLVLALHQLARRKAARNQEGAGGGKEGEPWEEDSDHWVPYDLTALLRAEEP